MASIFAKQADITQHPNRNKFDYHKNVYGTYKAGYLYPNLVMRAEPTSSFRIKTQFFLNFMPTAYPLQSPMRVIQHYFAIPMRLLWKDFENWAMGVAPDKVPPYVSQPAGNFYTGGLYDHLNLPTTVMSDDPVNIASLLNGLYSGSPTPSGVIRYQFASTGMVHATMGAVATIDDLIGSTGQVFTEDTVNFVFRNALMTHSASSYNQAAKSGNGWALPDGQTQSYYTFGFAVKVQGVLDGDSEIKFTPVLEAGAVYGQQMENVGSIALFCSEKKDDAIANCRLRYVGGSVTYNTPNPYYSRPQSFQSNDVQMMREVSSEYLDGTVYAVFLVRCKLTGPINALKPNTKWNVPLDLSEPVDFSNLEGVNPYYKDGSTDTDTTRLSALIPRAYEMVYNSFYRNKTGAQPFVVDGETKYNEWLPSDAGGADTYDYQLHRRNWELDAYTSCLPSPQLGNAPLVGITNINALGEVSYQNEDGTTSVIGRVKDGESAVVTDTNATTLEQSRSLVNLASSGISIADFRQTNALQTFLEQTLRTGLTYYDFIRGHFGKGPKKAELQMPEFLGGTSTPLQINMISNTTAGDVPLGAYAGQANAFGESKHSINCYCDDHCIILGIMCIVPDPAYSQLLPTYWKLDDPLDLYYPEFGELGLQPITYREVCPIQSKLDSLSDPSKKLTDVFGYQRPNHDLVWQADSLHGEFRKSLNRFVVNRRFGKRPELGNEFLTIDPAEVNRSFVLTTAEAGSSDDIAVGQTRHDIVARRPVHKVVVPSLGR